MKIRIKKDKFDEKIFSILIILLPFFYQYKGIGNTVSFGELVLFPFIMWYAVQDFFSKRLSNIDRPLLVFYAMALLLTALNSATPYFQISAAFTIIARLIYYMVLVYVARRHFNWQAVRNFYIICVFGFSVYLIIQFLFYHGMGIILPIYLKHSLQFPPEARPENIYRLGFRPSSLFLEASYYALFTMPGITILLFTANKSMMEKTTMVLACIGVVFSTSSAGIVGLVLLFVIKVFGDKEAKGAKAIISKSAVLLMCVIAALYIVYSENSTLLRNRLFSGGSIGERVLRGFIVFGKLGFIHKIIGVGIGNMEAYMNYYQISTVFDEGNLNACASVIQSFVYYGIIGGCFLLFYLFTIVRKSKGNIGFPFSLLITYMMCYEGVLYYFRFAFLIIILEAINRSEKEKRMLVNQDVKRDRYEYRY